MEIGSAGSDGVHLCHLENIGNKNFALSLGNKDKPDVEKCSKSAARTCICGTVFSSASSSKIK